ncbi:MULTISPECIES: hypothetical protein [Stenotrophomonas]|uniref:hypothetical protein n=1 Tax=Stenotrophomonas TaxID=40323 RepID=UPI001F08116F|nr:MULTISPECIES: hypothetical protein [Stenotrophomonas]
MSSILLRTLEIIVPLRAIAYASEAVPGLSIDNVDDLTRAATRFFPYWSMRWLPAQPTDIRIVSTGDWSGLNRSGGVHRLSLLVSQHLASPPAA